MTQLHCAGLPHSEILGSKVICTTPKLIAAYHVLHRLPEPRHPPFALICFFYFFARTWFPHVAMCCSNTQYMPLIMNYKSLIINYALLYYFLSLSFNMSKIVFNGQLTIDNWQLIYLTITPSHSVDLQCFTIIKLLLFLSLFSNSLITLLFLLSTDHCQLSISFVENKGLEPLTPCVQGRCSKPTELIPQIHLDFRFQNHDFRLL